MAQAHSINSGCTTNKRTQAIHGATQKAVSTQLPTVIK